MAVLFVICFWTGDENWWNECSLCVGMMSNMISTVADAKCEARHATTYWVHVWCLALVWLNVLTSWRIEFTLHKTTSSTKCRGKVRIFFSLRLMLTNQVRNFYLIIILWDCKLIINKKCRLHKHTCLYHLWQKPCYWFLILGLNDRSQKFMKCCIGSPCIH